MSCAPTLALDPTGRKIAVPHRYVSGAEAVAVKVRQALETVQGTYPSDMLYGIPLRKWLAQPGLSQVEIEGDVRQAIERASPAAEVQSVEAPLVGDVRTIKATFTVRCPEGDLATVTVGDDVNFYGPETWMVLIRPSRIGDSGGLRIHGALRIGPEVGEPEFGGSPGGF